MPVNCENSRMRRPSSTMDGSISRSRSSLAEPAVRAGVPPGSRRGSQQTWRSFSRASSTTMWLRASPLPLIASRTCFSIAARTVSYSSRWPPSIATVRVMTVFGGSSEATWSLRRRRMKGRMRWASSCARRRSLPRSMGWRQCWLNCFSLPSSPGSRKSNCVHSSPRWFSSGVPVRHSRCRACSVRSVAAARDLGFFTCCASSRISR
ncbi:hypothetical protein D3C75_322240 [compost metagenome]